MRYELENVAGEKREVFPLTGKNPKITYTRNDDRRYDFKKEIKEITFTGKDYQYFLGIETGEDRCTQHILHVYNDCSPMQEDLKFTGNFSSTSGTWDWDKCTVKFKVKEIDQYTCLEEDDEINIFDFPIDRVTLDMGITIKYVFDSEYGNPGSYSYADLYMAINNIPPGFILPSEFMDVGEGFYMKLFPEYISGSRIPFDEPFSTIDNAFPLKEVLNNLLDVACSAGLTFQSEFFEWNLSFPIPFSENKYTNLFLVQKSDVKRVNSSNNATKGLLKPIELIESLCKIFNLGYNISDGVLRLEHISFFDKEYGFDLTKNKRHEFNLQGTRKYSYIDKNLPREEKFKMMEAGYKDFIGEPITYKGSCVNDEEENKKEVTVDIITTDVLYCLENSAPDSENISDEGFVLIACDASNKIVFEPGILTDATPLNNTLSWAHLHRDVWKYGRVMKEGMMNGELTEFFSTVPTVKQDKFKVILDCNEIRTFNPLNQIKGTLGWGEIESAELGLLDCTLSIDLNIAELNNPSITNPEYGDFDDDHDEDFD